MLKYPIYEALIGDENEGILQISLVENPAVESLWEAFDAVEEENVPKMENYAIENEEQRLITGCFLRADYPILRRNDLGEYYYITFSKETIKLMVIKWLDENRANMINQHHKENTSVDGIYLQEVFIKNKEKGIDPKGFETVEDGSAFATYKVLDDEIWEKVKNGEFKGFSIECITEVAPVEEEKDIYDEIIEMLEKIKDNQR